MFNFFTVILSYYFLLHFCLFFFFFWPHCLAYGMLIPQPGIEPKDFTAVKVSSPNRWTTREFPICFLCACVHAKSLQSCLTVCDPMDSNPQGPSVHGILQARILEWVTMPSSKGFSWPRDGTQVFCLVGGSFTTSATWEAHAFYIRN